MFSNIFIILILSGWAFVSGHAAFREDLPQRARGVCGWAAVFTIAALVVQLFKTF